MSMMNRFCQTSAPFIPENALYNENIERNSETGGEKPKNILAALFGVVDSQNNGINLKQLNFDEQHFLKFKKYE